MRKKCFLFFGMIIGLLTITTAASGFIPQPARIGGTVTVDGTQLIQGTDTGYTFVITKQNGAAYVPVAEDTDGLNASDWYNIDIPIYEATDQPSGANPGDTAVIHVYKDGLEQAISTPVNGELTVGAMGSLSAMNIVTTAANQSQSIPTLNEWGMIIFMALFSILAVRMLKRKSYKA